MFLSAAPLQVFAQSEFQDFEAPVIEHNSSDYSEDNELQVFSATVADNVEVSSVFMYYRYKGQDEYKPVEMKRVATSSLYSVSIFTDESSESTIEYFLQAEDSAGNIVLKGFAFEPLVRTLSLPDTASTITQATEQQEVKLETEKPKSKVLYYVLGALAVGALAAGLSGDGDDPPRGCTDGVCEVTFTLTTP